MTNFNYLMLALAGAAVLLFVLLAVNMSRRLRGHGGFELSDPRPTSIPAPALTAVRAEAPDYRAWRLVERTLANPESAGGPLFRLKLMPEQDLPGWRPGAIARVYCGPAQEALDPDQHQAHAAGDYTVGSVPGDGEVELVLRLRQSGPGNEGQRSQWLCQTLQTGQQVALALRDNPDFLPPPDDVPLILIGNAIGLAGLLAHIKARPAGTRNWLIFGDRNSADDQALAAEITIWVASGHLERCDLVFPGDGEEQRHVTDQIEDAKAPLLDWVLAGGAVYVCGSEPMGEDVDATLGRLLGGEVVEALALEGRYRRSLY